LRSTRHYVYWANTYSGAQCIIGRANLDGSGAIQNFIEMSGFSFPAGIAVDGTYLYLNDSYNNAITRATLDGTSVNRYFITGAGGIYANNGMVGVAVDPNYIYWDNVSSNTIGRANLNGTGVNQSFITLGGATGLQYLTVDGTYIYWSNINTSSIGRAKLDGTGVNQNFITGITQPTGIAVDGVYIYWVNQYNTIGRASLDGTGINYSFITVPSSNFNGNGPGLAVSSIPEPSTGLLVIAGLLGLGGWRRVRA